MDASAICSTPFWNSSVSWETEKPYFSHCFQHLVLVIGSCGVLWIVAPFEFVKISKYHGSPTPWTTLSITKIVFKVILLVICILDLAKEVYAYVNYEEKGLDGLIAAVAYLLTIVLTVILTMMCKRRGLRVSLALPSFWMISTITTLISIYDEIQDLDPERWTSVASFVHDSIVFFISIIQLILSSIADKKTWYRGREHRAYCPLEGSSLPSRLTFSWLLRVLTKSVKSSLHQDYLVPLCYELKTVNVARDFYHECATGSRQNVTSQAQEEASLIENGEEDLESQDDVVLNTQSFPEKKSLFPILIKVALKFLLIASFLELVLTLLYFLPSYILNLILSKGKEDQEWHNYVYATALFVVLLFSSLADSQRKYYGLMAALRIKTAVMNAVFEKSLKTCQESDCVKQYITVDADNIFQMVCLLTEVWGAPLRLLIGLYGLWLCLGSSSFAGLAIAVLLIPMNILVEQGADYFQKKAQAKKGERLEVLSECLHGIKAVKFYAWEELFSRKLMSLRKSESTEMRKSGYIKIVFSFLTVSATSLIMLSTYAIYVLMGNSMNPNSIFVSFSLICLLRTPFRSILHLISFFIQGLSSVSRLQSFLKMTELTSLPTEEGATGNSVTLVNASFSWNGVEMPCLKNLNLDVLEGSLVAVIGETQSGKSSLLRALLGEMEKLDGTACVKGRIAFVGENAWIQSTTLEKNILFMRAKVEASYRKTIDACSLNHDIESLPAGDETEIGQKGVALSKEQRLKIDLARAVYQNADIYLLDDPLGPLESSLAEYLYHRVIGRSGLLKGKTRILTTTEADFLPLADHIIFLKDGCIVEQGTYSELTEKNGYLKAYLDLVGSTAKKRKSTECLAAETKDSASIKYFDRQCDVWFLTAGIPAKIEIESSISNEAVTASKGLFKKVAHYVKTIGCILTTLAVMAAFLACSCEVVSGIWLSAWTDKQFEKLKPEQYLLYYAGFILAEVLSVVSCGVSLYAASTNSAGKLHTWLITRIMRAPQIVFETTPYQNFIKSFDEDLHDVDEKIPMALHKWLLTVLKVPVILIAIFIASPILSVVVIPLVFGFLVIQKLYLNAWQQLQYLTSATCCPLSDLLEDTLQGISNIRASQASFHFLTRFNAKLNSHNNCLFLFFLVSRWLSCSVNIIGAVFVFITTTVVLTLGNKEDGFSGLVIVFSMQVAEYLILLVYMSSVLNVDMLAFDRLKTFSEIKQESEWEDPINAPPNSWPDSGLVRIQNLSTAYGEGLYPVLHNINIDIKPGEKVAIIGKEDSGIHTFLYSLFRFIEPSCGEIIIDNIDISKIGLRDLRSRLAIIPQDTLIFNGSVRQNLDPYQEFKDEELWSALEIADLKAHISSLDSSVERKMSNEKKNLLSIARCVLKRPKIVILDESETYAKNEENVFQNSTILKFCSHQISEHNGRIIKISSGEVIEDRSSNLTSI